MNITHNFEDFYSNDFIDPLYAQYYKRPFTFNSETENPNEVRYNKGLNFRLKYNFYPPPMGYQKDQFGFCKRMIKQKSTFYENNYVDDLYSLKDFTNINNKLPISYFNWQPK